MIVIYHDRDFENQNLNLLKTIKLFHLINLEIIIFNSNKHRDKQ